MFSKMLTLLCVVASARDGLDAESKGRLNAVAHSHVNRLKALRASHKAQAVGDDEEVAPMLLTPSTPVVGANGGGVRDVDMVDMVDMDYAEDDGANGGGVRDYEMLDADEDNHALLGANGAGVRDVDMDYTEDGDNGAGGIDVDRGDDDEGDRDV
eukprot:GHVH01013718.1.p1 GENE.GHVH01013718.1~~GHVH01013718.1.p1  ORF type:complete len:155 (-),score=37.91 GHVH01013718.1:11-475(-)